MNVCVAVCVTVCPTHETPMEPLCTVCTVTVYISMHTVNMLSNPVIVNMRNPAPTVRRLKCGEWMVNSSA